MGGSVSVSSAVGVGTAFTVALPQDDGSSTAVLPGRRVATVVLPPDGAAPTVAPPQDDAS